MPNCQCRVLLNKGVRKKFHTVWIILNTTAYFYRKQNLNLCSSWNTSYLNFNEMLFCIILMKKLHYTTCRYDNNAKQKPSYRSINAFTQWANICWMLGLSQGSDRSMGAEEVCKSKLSFCTVYRKFLIISQQII